MNRLIVGLSLAALAGLLAVPPALPATGPAPARHHKPPIFKTVTRTFANTDLTAIPLAGQANPYPSEIAVGGLKQGKLLDVNLRLVDFGHGFPDDVDVLLESPDGKKAIVMSDVGGNDDVVNLKLTLDDEAAAPSRPSTGSIRTAPGSCSSSTTRTSKAAASTSAGR